jgi:hypothetical protein
MESEAIGIKISKFINCDRAAALLNTHSGRCGFIQPYCIQSEVEALLNPLFFFIFTLHTIFNIGQEG